MNAWQNSLQRVKAWAKHINNKLINKNNLNAWQKSAMD